jgi:predicted RNase H-like HicB family nuclease
MRNVFMYKDESGTWVASCPSLPGCISQGKTREQALANIREAIQLFVEALEAKGRPVPKEKFESLMVAV